MPLTRTRQTLKDVAARARVSVMTASRAIRNQRYVSAQIRAAVRKAAAELGYKPNPLISALMTCRRSAQAIAGTNVVGFLNPFPTRDGWKGPKINLEFYSGARGACESHGYKLEEFWLREPGMTGARMSQILYARNIAGLIICPSPTPHAHLRLDWEKVAAVALGYSLAWPRLHRAVNHQFRSMQMALRQLRKRGYRRPGLALTASYDQRVDHHWVGSFLLEQQRHGVRRALPRFVPPDNEWTQKKFTDWARKKKPDVVITQHEEVYEWLCEMGLVPPRDIGLIHLNCPREQPHWAGIVQNAQAVGAAAIDLLVGMLQRNERGIPPLPQYILVEGAWRDGTTIRAQLMPR